MKLAHKLKIIFSDCELLVTGSGPPSGKFSEGGALLEEEPVSSADMGKRRLVGELPPLEEVEGNGAAGHQTVSSPVQIRKLTMSTAPSRQLSSDSERGRVALVTGLVNSIIAGEILKLTVDLPKKSTLRLQYLCKHNRVFKK